MTHEEIIKLVRQVRDGGHRNQLDLINFANLIAAAEREACAKVVENYCGAWGDEGYALSAAIRARGQA